MIVRTPLLACFCLALTADASAQVGGVTIDDLRAPTSPAFVLLGITPAAVERPENPKALAVNLVHTLSTSSGLPQNYALELTPYWMANHTTLTFHDYQRPTVAQSIAQTLSLSIATTPLAQSATLAAGTRLGAAVRAHVWNGRPNPTLESLVGELEDINGIILDKLAAGATRAAIQDDLNAASAKALEIQALDGQRLGFFLTVAAGQVWNYPGNNVTLAMTDRRGAWVTPSYRFRACGADSPACHASFDAIGVLRALRDPGLETQWDMGARLLWQPTKELTLSFESLRRNKTDAAPGSDRTVGMLEYRVTRDIALYATFGQDFAKATGIEPLVSLMGLNFGFGPNATVAPVTER